MNKLQQFFLSESVRKDPNFIGLFLINEEGREMTPTILDKDRDGEIVIKSGLIDGDVLNRNERMYPTNELVAGCFKDSRIDELRSAKSLFGEAGHPMLKDILRQQTIDPNNISHCILELSNVQNMIEGIVSSIPTPQGTAFKNLIKFGTKVAFSLRGLGGLISSPRGNIVKGLRIVTWDWVIFPSHKYAYQKAILDSSGGILKESSGLSLDLAENAILDSDTSAYCENVNNLWKEEDTIMESATAFVKDNSLVLKNLGNQFNINYDSISLDESMSFITMECDGRESVVKVDDFIMNELMDEISKKK